LSNPSRSKAREAQLRELNIEAFSDLLTIIRLLLTTWEVQGFTPRQRILGADLQAALKATPTGLKGPAIALTVRINWGHTGLQLITGDIWLLVETPFLPHQEAQTFISREPPGTLLETAWHLLSQLLWAAQLKATVVEAGPTFPVIPLTLPNVRFPFAARPQVAGEPLQEVGWVLELKIITALRTFSLISHTEAPLFTVEITADGLLRLAR